MTTTEMKQMLRNDFIEGLVEFSNGKVTKKEANEIADKKLRPTDFLDDSPLAHKGPYWLAKTVLRTMKIIK